MFSLVSYDIRLGERRPHRLDLAKRSVLGGLEPSGTFGRVVCGEQRKRLNGQHRSVHKHPKVADSVGGRRLQRIS